MRSPHFSLSFGVSHLEVKFPQSNEPSSVSGEATVPKPRATLLSTASCLLQQASDLDLAASESAFELTLTPQENGGAFDLPWLWWAWTSRLHVQVRTDVDSVDESLGNKSVRYLLG